MAKTDKIDNNEPKVEKTSVKQTVVSKAKKLKSKLSTKSDS